MENTPVHPHLWHRDFWLLALSCFLLTMPMYMLIPLLPLWLDVRTDLSHDEVAYVMLSYGVGLFLFGPVCNYLIQRYRRNVVFILAALGVGALLMLLFVFEHSSVGWSLPCYVLCGVRFALGALFGLAQMVLLSTLIIDMSESSFRTNANYAVVWFGRFPFVLGPLLALQLYRVLDIDAIAIIMAILAFLSALSVMVIRIPFKAPDDSLRVFSTDRFLLKNSHLCFLNLLLFTAFFGMLLYWLFDGAMYALLMVGFYLALRLGKPLLGRPDRSIDMVLAFCLSGIAFLLPYLLSAAWAWNYLSPVLLGFVAGLVCNRFMLVFLNISHHCERGTSQSTFFLSWESGIALGLFLTFILPDKETNMQVALLLWLSAFVLYLTLTHRWYMSHKNRTSDQ